MSEEGNGADIALEVGGQKVNVRNVKSLNTILTFLTLLVACLIAYAFYSHAQDTRDDRGAFVGAIKEQTTAIKESAQAVRENTCVQTYQGPPSGKADFCRQVTR